MAANNSRAIAGRILDPVRFADAVLGVDLWDTQKHILRSVATHQRTAVKACHASSKTFTAAVVALWWVTRYQDGVVLTTAPTWMQVQRQVWPELHRLLARSQVAYPTPLQSELRLGPDRYILGLATDQGVRFQGYHGRILVIVDEAPGISQEIWEAIAGIRAGGQVHVLALGNPTVPSGPFYDAFTAERAGWSTFTISAFDTPNLRGLTLDAMLALPPAALDDNLRPYLVTRRWVAEQWEAWGRHGAPQWQSRVLGEFPEQSDSALFELGWLDRWQQRSAAFNPNGALLEAGVDVAGPGKSDTVVAVRQGTHLLALEAWPRADSRGVVAAMLNRYRGRLHAVKVDAVGQGHYFAQHLADLGFPVMWVNVGERAYEPERFANLKAQFYWTLRGYAAAGQLSGLADDVAYSQLASLRFEYTPRGLVAMESKAAMERRGIASPDRAEAIMLAYAPVQAPPRTYLVQYYDPVRIGPQI